MFAIYDHLIHLTTDSVPRDVTAEQLDHLTSTAQTFRCPLRKTVYGTLLNDRNALEALGDAVNVPPYKAPPKAPILYVKPANTLVGHGSHVEIPDDTGVEIGGSLGIVIGRTASRVAPDHAFDYIAGYTVIADLSIPHASVYRPSVRFRARDGFCVVGPAVVAKRHVTDPDNLSISVSGDGISGSETSTSTSIRSVARLIADVTDFMTLAPGDVLTLGVPFGSPVSRDGGDINVTIGSLPTLSFSLKRTAKKGEV
ncbi:fumarylacetoacetate hydrolase family protein [Paraburkholderia sp. MPAMCS5]|uniref:fumarylacetoacetate hydrolase family protein n=1 Tax=Paraburkholderia sp. MPAMCS5 TaxID=3112563 RepID=UPI002E17BDFD|nr:fumarylacetoacetate hydrolase family protein [Paraburkholderia sp. MPAMCS5]